MQIINYVFGIIYLVLFLIYVFTLQYSVIFYTQALLTGYCLSSVKKKTNPAFPLWVALVVNAVSIVYDRTLVINTIILCVEWVHFSIIMTIFLVNSKDNILSEKEINGFNDKVLVCILFLFDIIASTPHIGLLIYIILDFQNPIYTLNTAILMATLIHTLFIWDYSNLLLVLIISFYLGYGRSHRI